MRENILDLLEKLLDYERAAFFFLNGSDSPFLDSFMWLFSTRVVWLPLAAFILFIMTYKKDIRRVLLVFFAVFLVVLLCDQFASSFCKPFFERPRPTSHPDFMDEVSTVFGYRSGRFGFISSHSANAIGYATFMILLFRHKFYTLTILFWSVFTAYTRVYLGVHFISDIVVGAIAGLFFGYIVYKLYLYCDNKFFGYKTSNPDTLYSEKDKKLISSAIWVNIALMLIFNIHIVTLIRSYS
jgi:Membrane-associated phospholipid phosphatase